MMHFHIDTRQQTFVMKLRGRNRIEDGDIEQEPLIAENNEQHTSKNIRRYAWKLARRTWKFLKIGFKATAASSPFCVALEPTAIAATVVQYHASKHEQRR